MSLFLAACHNFQGYTVILKAILSFARLYLFNDMSCTQLDCSVFHIINLITVWKAKPCVMFREETLPCLGSLDLYKGEKSISTVGIEAERSSGYLQWSCVPCFNRVSVKAGDNRR